MNFSSPCFDEPNYKAEFEITIEHPDRSIALTSFPMEVKTKCIRKINFY